MSGVNKKIIASNMAVILKADCAKMPTTKKINIGAKIVLIISIIQIPLIRRDTTHRHTTNELKTFHFHS